MRPQAYRKPDEAGIGIAAWIGVRRRMARLDERMEPVMRSARIERARLAVRGLSRIAFGRMLDDPFLTLSGRFDLARVQRGGLDADLPVSPSLAARHRSLARRGRVA